MTPYNPITARPARPVVTQKDYARYHNLSPFQVCRYARSGALPLDESHKGIPMLAEPPWNKARKPQSPLHPIQPTKIQCNGKWEPVIEPEALAEGVFFSPSMDTLHHRIEIPEGAYVPEASDKIRYFHVQYKRSERDGVYKFSAIWPSPLSGDLDLWAYLHSRLLSGPDSWAGTAFPA